VAEKALMRRHNPGTGHTKPNFSATRWDGRLCGSMNGDEPVRSKDIAGVFAAGCRGFGGQAATLERRPDVVADLDFGHTVDLLGNQAAVADELAGASQRQQPQPKAVFAVQPLVGSRRAPRGSWGAGSSA
jgi:hypothetical protein